ncbi:hypothetical protein [Streptomyces decoyicus]
MDRSQSGSDAAGRLLRTVVRFAVQQTLQDLSSGLNDAWRDYTTQPLGLRFIDAR